MVLIHDTHLRGLSHAEQHALTALCDLYMIWDQMSGYLPAQVHSQLISSPYWRRRWRISMLITGLDGLCASTQRFLEQAEVYEVFIMLIG